MAKKKIDTDIKIVESDDYKKTSPEKNKLTEKQLMDLLSDERKIDLKIEKEFLGLKESYIVLMIVKPKNYSEAILGLFRRFVGKEKIAGVYITVNKSFEKLSSELNFHNIDINNVKFIDMTTMMVGSTPIRAKNVSYLESATDLTELMLLLDKKLGSLRKDNCFLILDSVSTLLVYNEPAAIEKLIHALIGKINKFRARGVIIMVQSKEHEGAIQTISQFCDKVAMID